MKTMIPRTYNDIMTLVGLQQLRRYCTISEETEANLFEAFVSGKLQNVLATRDGMLKLTFTGDTEPMVMETVFNNQNGNVDAVTLYPAAFNVIYSAAYLAAHRSSSGGGGGSGGSSGNNNNNNNHNNNNH
ncbi:MAG: hypothetical protein IJI34_02875 [Clostridia bacterium]|nr:hypothetical protein [Clostridia bacterium]